MPLEDLDLKRSRLKHAGMQDPQNVHLVHTALLGTARASMRHRSLAFAYEPSGPIQSIMFMVTL